MGLWVRAFQTETSECKGTEGRTTQNYLHYSKFTGGKEKWASGVKIVPILLIKNEKFSG